MFCEICKTKVHSLKNHIKEKHLDLFKDKTIDEINKTYYDTYVDQSQHICPICNKESKFNYKQFLGHYNMCCESLSCVRKYQFNVAKEKWEAEHPCHNYSEKLEEKNKRGAATIKKNLQAKYGEHITNISQLQSTKDKVKQTNIERYGDWYGKTEQYREQVKQNALEKYGVDSINKTEEKRNKYKQTCIEKYGTDNYFGSVENREHIKEIVQEKYEVDNVIQLKEVQDKISETKRRNGTFSMSLLEETFYNQLVKIFGEADIIRQYQDDRYFNYKTHQRMYCDFYIKSKDLFIELQGSNDHGYKPFYVIDEENIDSLECIHKDTRVGITGEYFLDNDIIKRSLAKYHKLNYIEVFFKRRNYVTSGSVKFIINNYIPGEDNVFIEPLKKQYNNVNTLYYDIENIDIIL